MTPEKGRRARRRLPSRDQHETGFTAILSALVSRVPAALGVALVDRGGETVDYAGCIAPFDVRVAAAHWRIVVDEAQAQRSFQGLRWLSVRAGRRGYVARVLPQGYTLVVVLESTGATDGWHRGVAACASALAEEAGWTWSGPASPEWSFARVSCDERGRPLSVQVGAEHRAIEVLGAVHGSSGLARFERGWRVRVAGGVEATLIREPGGSWYTDEPLHVDVAPPPLRAIGAKPPRNTLTRRRR